MPFVEPNKSEMGTRIFQVITFATLGLGSSVLWNQLLLSADVLIALFGESALSTACLSQNSLCAATMIFFTFFPIQQSRRCSIILAIISYGAMVGCGAALMYLIHFSKLTLPMFVGLVALS